MPSPPDPLPPTPSAHGPGRFLAEEAARRQLTTAHLALKRGQIAEAERAVTEALVQFPEDAAALEILGDVRLAKGDFDGAAASYREALQREPARATAEAKLARATLRHSEDMRRQTFGMAYASENRALMQAGAQNDRGHLLRLAVLSAVLPGLGQIFAGAFLKGGILIGLFALGCLLLTFAGIRQPLSGIAILALILLAADWLYAVFDAARSGNST